MKLIRQRCRGRTGHSNSDNRFSYGHQLDRGDPVGLLLRSIGDTHICGVQVRNYFR